MKTRVLIILFGFVMLFPLQLVYAPPAVNPDWQSYPYCSGGCSNEYLKTEWAKYYDIKGEEWMEQKRQEMFAAYENENLYDWIDSDYSKANQNVFTYYYIAGDIPNHDGEYFDSIPSCDEVILVDEDEICYTEKTPPCPEPSFRKDGLCVIEKRSLCDEGTVYNDGVCLVVEINDEFSDEQICGPGTELVDGICHVIETERQRHGHTPPFVDALFFMQLILPFFVPGAIIFVVVNKTPRYTKTIRLSVCIPAIIVILYFLSGLFLGWYPPGYA